MQDHKKTVLSDMKQEKTGVIINRFLKNHNDHFLFATTLCSLFENNNRNNKACFILSKHNWMKPRRALIWRQNH